MANFSELFPKKVTPADAAIAQLDSSPSPVANAGRTNPFAKMAATSTVAAKPESVSPAASTSQGGGISVPAEPSAKPAVSRLANIFGSQNRVDGGTTSQAGTTESGSVNADSRARDERSDFTDVGSTGNTIDSLSDLDQLAKDATVEAERTTSLADRFVSGFADETPATKPTRDLPEGLDKGQLAFVDLIDGVYQITHDVELLSNVIRGIMIELKSNPQYIKLVAKDDVRAWVRAMRDNMGLARVKKAEKKAGTGTRKSGGKAAQDQDVLSALDDLGIDLDNL